MAWSSHCCNCCLTQVWLSRNAWAWNVAGVSVAFKNIRHLCKSSIWTACYYLNCKCLGCCTVCLLSNIILVSRKNCHDSHATLGYRQRRFNARRNFTQSYYWGPKSRKNTCLCKDFWFKKSIAIVCKSFNWIGRVVNCIDFIVYNPQKNNNRIREKKLQSFQE